MQIRFVHLRSRNPLVGVLLLAMVLALLLAFLAVGLTLAAGAAALAGVALLVRRVLGRRGPSSVRSGVRPGQEVFPSPQQGSSHRLPPGPG